MGLSDRWPRIQLGTTSVGATHLGVTMYSSLRVRSLVVGAALMAAVIAGAAAGVVAFSTVAAAATIVILLVLLGGLVLDDTWAVRDLSVATARLDQPGGDTAS